MDEAHALVPVTRLDGREYRPRKITACAVADEDGELSGVVVLGTHDTGLAQWLADRYAAWQLGSCYAAVDPETGWFREGYESGQLRWTSDPVHGRAGIMFRELVERS